MKTGSIRPATIEIHPASAERWDDLEKLFGPHGAFGNCWCMYWRLKRSDFSKMSGDEKKAALKTLTTGKLAPGVLAYGDGQPIGWCSIGPRADFSPLDRSRTLKRVDDTPVWSIVCFFIARPYRRQGVMAALLSGAVDYARQNPGRLNYASSGNGTVLGTSMMLGALPTWEMGVKSATASYGSLPPKLGPMECVLDVASSST